MKRLRPGSRVKILPRDTEYTSAVIRMLPRPGGYEAIIREAETKLYGGKYENMYEIVKLDSKGNPINISAWYEDDYIRLISDDLHAGQEIIENYDESCNTNGESY